MAGEHKGRLPVAWQEIADCGRLCHEAPPGLCVVCSQSAGERLSTRLWGPAVTEIPAGSFHREQGSQPGTQQDTEG